MNDSHEDNRSRPSRWERMTRYLRTEWRVVVLLVIAVPFVGWQLLSSPDSIMDQPVHYPDEDIIEQTKIDEETMPETNLPQPTDVVREHRDDEISRMFNNFSDGTDTIGHYVGGAKRYYPDIGPELEVDWLSRAEPVGAEDVRSLFASLSTTSLRDGEALLARCEEDPGYIFPPEAGYPYEGIGTASCQVHLFRTGAVTAPDTLAGSPVYIAAREEIAGLGGGYHVEHVIYHEGEQILISVGNTNELLWSAGRIDHTFTELSPPNGFRLPDSSDELRLVGAVSYQGPFGGTGMPNNYGGVMDIVEGTIVPSFSTDEVAFVDPEYGPVYIRDHRYHFVMPDGSTYEYDLIPSFFVEPAAGEVNKYFYQTGFRPEISWQDGITTSARYILGGELRTVGCGTVLDRQNVVSDESWFDESLLVPIGETPRGDLVYELSDKADNPFYQRFFDYGFYAAHVGEITDGTLRAFDEREVEEEVGGRLVTRRVTTPTDEALALFLSEVPIFFWQDSVGAWRAYMRDDYRTLAECGKPVIYLYPEQTMDVNVRVAPNGGFTTVIPEYPAGGWTVRATPDGQLYNYADGKIYDYLFWEGKGSGPQYGREGFVFARAEVYDRMVAILKQLGLRGQEITDFLEFWEPKMTTREYVYVRFMPQELFDQVAPLSVRPEPDTTIRVFMDFIPLSRPIDVSVPVIETPVRDGFTVVEWGGVLR